MKVFAFFFLLFGPNDFLTFSRFFGCFCCFVSLCSTESVVTRSQSFDIRKNHLVTHTKMFRLTMCCGDDDGTGKISSLAWRYSSKLSHVGIQQSHVWNWNICFMFAISFKHAASANIALSLPYGVVVRMDIYSNGSQLDQSKSSGSIDGNHHHTASWEMNANFIIIHELSMFMKDCEFRTKKKKDWMWTFLHTTSLFKCTSASSTLKKYKKKKNGRLT